MIRKILTIIMVLITIIIFLGFYNEKAESTCLQILQNEPVKVGVFLPSFDDPYEISIKKALEEFEKESEGKVQYSFFNGEKDQAIQNQQLNTLLQKKEVDLILLNVMNKGEVKYCIDRIKENNIPVIMFGGVNVQDIKSYNKAYWIGTDTREGGVLQGEIIVDLWNKNKGNIDKNKDNIMQYIMIKGPNNDMYAIERTKYSISTVNKTEIKTKELAARECNWSKEEAKNNTKSLLLRFGKNIEMIIANNDSMAIGAIEALQESGYNIGDKSMTIPVIGFDGIKEAKDLITKGIMLGTVIQDPYDYAKAFYSVGMNLVYGKNPIDGTEYKFDDTGISIILPYKGIMINVD